MRLKFEPTDNRVGKFQSTHPRRVRHRIVLFCCQSLMFQSTHPRRVRLLVTTNETMVVMFQSTHPRRVRHLNITVQWQKKSFNPRTHVGCDKEKFSKDQISIMFQSTHPRRVRLIAHGKKGVACTFQSTHPRRVRQQVSHGLPSFHCFNPRTHVGCDTVLMPIR